MHTRDYSDETARVVDEEVERILREQEERAMAVLQQHRKGLDAVAKALRDAETIDGASVTQLVDEAFGKPVHPKPAVRSATRDPDAARPDATVEITKRNGGKSDPDATQELSSRKR